MIDFEAVGQALIGQMEFQGDTAASLAQQWNVSKRTVQNAARGKKLTADMFLQVCMYIGANPLSFWREGMAVDYSALGGMDNEFPT